MLSRFWDHSCQILGGISLTIAVLDISLHFHSLKLRTIQGSITNHTYIHSFDISRRFLWRDNIRNYGITLLKELVSPITIFCSGIRKDRNCVLRTRGCSVWHLRYAVFEKSCRPNIFKIEQNLRLKIWDTSGERTIISTRSRLPKQRDSSVKTHGNCIIKKLKIASVFFNVVSLQLRRGSR